MPKNKSIIYQVKETLTQKLCIGEKKHLAKQQGTASNGVYAWDTLKTYLPKCCAFAKWAKTQHGCKTLDDARKHVDAYIQNFMDKKYSAWTQKTIASALAKLYGCSTKNFIQAQSRRRTDSVRSRKNKAKFSESRNKEFVDFCKATGLRRHEIKYLKPENLSFDETTGRYTLVNIKSKGGRVRSCPILSKQAVERIKNTLTG